MYHCVIIVDDCAMLSVHAFLLLATARHSKASRCALSTREANHIGKEKESGLTREANGPVIDSILPELWHVLQCHQAFAYAACF